MTGTPSGDISGEVLLAARGGAFDAIAEICGHYQERMLVFASAAGVEEPAEMVQSAVVGSLLALDADELPSLADFERDLFTRLLVDVDARPEPAEPVDSEPTIVQGPPPLPPGPPVWSTEVDVEVGVGVDVGPGRTDAGDGAVGLLDPLPAGRPDDIGSAGPGPVFVAVPSTGPGVDTLPDVGVPGDAIHTGELAWSDLTAPAEIAGPAPRSRSRRLLGRVAVASCAASLGAAGYLVVASSVPSLLGSVGPEEQASGGNPPTSTAAGGATSGGVAGGSAPVVNEGAGSTAFDGIVTTSIPSGGSTIVAAETVTVSDLDEPDSSSSTATSSRSTDSAAPATTTVRQDPSTTTTSRGAATSRSTTASTGATTGPTTASTGVTTTTTRRTTTKPVSTPVLLTDFGDRVVEDRGFRFEDLRGYDFTGATIRNVTFEAVDLRGVSFAGAELSNVTIVRSNLTGANFVDARLDRVEFGDSNISGADFTGAELINGSVSGYWRSSNPPIGLSGRSRDTDD